MLILSPICHQVLLQGIPRSAIPDDIERFLSGCQYDASSMQIFLKSLLYIAFGFYSFLSSFSFSLKRILCVTFLLCCRQAFPDPVKMALVRFPTPSLAMNAYITKNKGFCLNSQILVRVLQ